MRGVRRFLTADGYVYEADDIVGPTCRHLIDLSHLDMAQAASVIFNCNAGLIHNDDSEGER